MTNISQISALVGFLLSFTLYNSIAIAKRNILK